jgi:apolipoprotein N-acyltransferase
MAAFRAEASQRAGGPGRRIAAFIAGQTGVRRQLVAIAGGATAALSLPPAGLWPALVLGLGVLIWLLDGVWRQQVSLRRRLASAALVGWSFGFGYFAASLYWIGFAFLVDADRFAVLMPLGVAALPAGLALFWAAAAAAAMTLWQPRGAGRAVMLAVALAAGEWLRGHLFTGFPWNAPGYAAGALDGLAQGAALVGLYGMTLLVLLWAGLAAVLATETLSRRALFAAALVLAAAPLALAAGHWRLATASSAMFDHIGLRIVQANIAQGDKWLPESQEEVVSAHLDLSTAGGLAGVTHLVWPESAVPMVIDEAPEPRHRLVRMLPRDTTLLLGALRRELDDAAGAPGLRIYNSLFAVSGSGDLLARYDKWRLVPFGEYLPLEGLLKPLGLRQLVPLPLGFSAGPAPRNVTIEGTPAFAPLVCYEAIFPRVLIDRKNRPEWMLNVTNDGWFGNTAGPYQHLEQARFRAIEEGLALVRAANTGISAVVDPYGRILHRLQLGEAGRIDSPLPRPLSPTIYAQWGDFPFLFMLAIAGLVAAASRRLANEP